MANPSKDELARVFEENEAAIAEMALFPQGMPVFARYAEADMAKPGSDRTVYTIPPCEVGYDWRAHFAGLVFEEDDLDFIDCVQGPDGVWHPRVPPKPNERTRGRT